MVSKKSLKFLGWVGTTCGENREVPLILVELEEAARLVAHDIDAMGEPSEKSLRALVRASKKLQAAYNEN